MRSALAACALAAYALGACVVVACAHAPEEKVIENPPHAPAPSSSARSDEGSRSLTLDECVELGQWIVQACEERENQRSTQIDGYCADMSRGTAGDARWVERECVPNIRRMDAMCIKSTTNIRKIMDCERSILR